MSCAHTITLRKRGAPALSAWLKAAGISSRVKRDDQTREQYIEVSQDSDKIRIKEGNIVTVEGNILISVEEE